jgi:hypothetical protein
MVELVVFVSVDDALAEVVFNRMRMSDLALAHRLEDTPGTPVEDAAEIRTLLGL